MLAENDARSSLMSFIPAFGLLAFGLPKPGIVALASRICGGTMYVKPSLTRISALRPSFSEPMWTISDLIAESDT